MFLVFIVLVLLVLVLLVFKLFYRRPQQKKQIRKLAFLFLIYDGINHECLWQKFFKNADPDKYSIYVHYKTQKKSEFFDTYKLINCIETNYADITLVKAHKLLLEKALKDENNYKFINVSQACIPLKTFTTVYNKLTQNNSNHFNLLPRKDIFPRCLPLLKRGFRTDQIKKSANWFILNRKYAKICVDTDHSSYSDIDSPEEHFFITTCGLVKTFENDSEITNNAAAKATTFTNWNGMDYPFDSGNPKTYNSITTEEIQYLLTSPALFGRKFTPKCTNLQKYVLAGI